MVWKHKIWPFLQNTPVSKQMQQRNSNLRELPVAPGNTNTNSARPATTPTSPAANIKPVARTTQGMRPGQNTQPMPDGGKGRGQAVAKTESQPEGAGRTVVRKEIPRTPSGVTQQVRTRRSNFCCFFFLSETRTKEVNFKKWACLDNT